MIKILSECFKFYSSRFSTDFLHFPPNQLFFLVFTFFQPIKRSLVRLKSELQHTEKVYLFCFDYKFKPITFKILKLKFIDKNRKCVIRKPSFLYLTKKTYFRKFELTRVKDFQEGELNLL